MIFVDTGAFLGRYLVNDQHHAEAVSLWEKVRADRERCVTSNLVLSETITLLGRRASHKFAAEKAKLIYASSNFEIMRPTDKDEHNALQWFDKFADQEVSFTDCVSFALMRKARLQGAFSFDQHFERAGFKLLG